MVTWERKVPGRGKGQCTGSKEVLACLQQHVQITTRRWVWPEQGEQEGDGQLKSEKWREDSQTGLESYNPLKGLCFSTEEIGSP